MSNVESTSVAAHTIKNFCAAHEISLTTYFALKREGIGPREMLVGKTGKRITEEAAAEWRRRMEERASSDRTGEAA